MKLKHYIKFLDKIFKSRPADQGDMVSYLLEVAVHDSDISEDQLDAINEYSNAILGDRT